MAVLVTRSVRPGGNLNDPTGMSSPNPEGVPRDPDRFEPVFLLATPRSYSSVITAMIGQHPEMVGFPELKLFAYATVGDLEGSLPEYWRRRGARHRSPGLVRAVAQFVFGGQEIASLNEAQTWLRQRKHWSGADVLDFLLAFHSPRRGIEKSPENVESDEALRRLSSAYPRAKYLHLTRHPVSTQKSLQDHLLRRFPGYTMAGQPMLGIAGWVATQQRILSFAASLSPDRYVRIKGEDILGSPRSALASIAAWLGLRADDDAITAMMRPEESPFACEGPRGSGVTGGLDPEFLRNPGLRPVQPAPSLEPPAGWIDDARLWNCTVAIANELGYA
ncbi:MAG TPA: sulfotransferase [Candidatus Sulfotelmatobacter sp.]|nr:sulfotransferase [Candidatus Sulfotelmatobacter sp.]